MSGKERDASEPLTTKEFFALDVISTTGYDPNRTALASDVVLATDIMSPGSRVNDRHVEPWLYHDADIPSRRIERSGRHLLRLTG